MHVLITGGAGFIGSNLVRFLLNKGLKITVIDNFDEFYSPKIKFTNIKEFLNNEKFDLINIDMHDLPNTDSVNGKFDMLIHLASKGGVRLSIKQKEIYHEVNVEGTQQVFEYVIKNNIPKVVFASSSSIYGNSKDLPWHEDIYPLQPISPYAFTKLLCEQMGMEYSKKHNFDFIALRFFSVYGPQMRPDLALYSFSKKILNNEPIRLFGDGSSMRDYTYVDDIVEGIYSAMLYNDNKTDIFNLGYGKAHSLLEMVKTLEKHLNKKAILEFTNSIKEEADKTWANTEKAKQILNFIAHTDFDTGVELFCKWFVNKCKN
jgi:UDP-glucuronate 4-epimerase